MRALPFLIAYTLPACVLHGYALGGWWTFEIVPFAFVLIPLVDWAVGRDERNLPPAAEAGWAEAWSYRLVVWAWVPLQLALIGWGLWTVSHEPLTWVEWAGLTVATGLTTGTLGIVYAHELMHRPGRFERALAEVLMASVSYTHFCIEHVHGHHRRVGTPPDPATARFGESIYAFYPRTVLGGFASAWRIEAERLRRRRLPWLSRHNRMLRYLGCLAVAYLAILAVFGLAGVAFFALQGVVAFSLLEVINYLEHYGLTRREIAPGRYEPVAPRHSWNATWRLTNWYLINLARHADHHQNAGRRYQLLRHFDADEAPQLPGDYAFLAVVALVPPLWFRLMNPRVEAWRRRLAAAPAAAAAE